VGGIITTPHLREKVGQYLKEGDLICEIEEPGTLEAEVPLDEQEVARVQPGQSVDFKARSLPWQPFQGKVERLAPLAVAGKVQSTLTVSCSLGDAPAELRSGMTGYARISCGQTSLASALSGRMLRYVRTEFWW
jgi:putative peptide zinc metalloprotease protein